MEYLFNAAIKGLIEGFTEFLPISSTAHLILVRDLFPLTADLAARESLDNLFDIVIQLPAILAIIILFWRRLSPTIKTLPTSQTSQFFWGSILIAFIPAAVIGVLAKKIIEMKLHGTLSIALAMIIGGIVLLFVEKISKPSRYNDAQTLPLKIAFGIGLIQCLGMIPGVSRSGATIVGGRILGLSRTSAAEFSFFLALPTMFGACTYKMIKDGGSANWSTHWDILLVGSVLSFISAWAVVKVFIRLIETRHGFTMWGWYRIALGLLLLLTT